jgi:ParB family chromosome partitioning protein
MKTEHLTRLLGGRLEADAATAGQTVGVKSLPSAKSIEVDRIVADPSQPRTEFDDEELDRLAASLRDAGQRETIRVRWDAKQDRYVIVSGERRWRAAQRAGIPTLMAVIDEGVMADDRLLEMQLIENCLRVDLSAVESGRAYRSLMTTWNCSQRELAARLHVSESKVSRALAALDLPVAVQKEIALGNRGGTTAVKQARRKPAARAVKRQKSVRLSCPAGSAVVTVKAGHSLVDVLTGLLEQERVRGAA